MKARLLRRCRRAVAALEFAGVAPVLLVVLGGTVDFGLANYNRTALANAVAAGAEYGLLQGSSVSVANVKTLVQNASFLTGVVATVPALACYCVTGFPPTQTSATCAPAGTKSTAANSTTCADGSFAGYYMSISANYAYTGMLGLFSDPSGFNMTETALVRLPQ
jgi:Flp pilus assembly protein TadG